MLCAFAYKFEDQALDAFMGHDEAFFVFGMLQVIQDPFQIFLGKRHVPIKIHGAKRLREGSLKAGLGVLRNAFK